MIIPDLPTIVFFPIRIQYSSSGHSRQYKKFPGKNFLLKMRVQYYYSKGNNTCSNKVF